MEWPNVSRRLVGRPAIANHPPAATFGHSYLRSTREVTNLEYYCSGKLQLRKVGLHTKELGSSSFVTPQLHYFFTMRQPKYLFLIATLALLITGCKKEEPQEKPAPVAVAIPPQPVPSFDAERVMKDVDAQMAMGPRVPNTPAHDKAVQWLQTELKQYTDLTQLQPFTEAGYAPGEQLKLTNVLASFNPNATYRVLILSHFDSRPWADQGDSTKPVPAANDGASGIAVMLELARQMHDHPPPIGVDLLFDDGEDYGKDNVDGLNKFFLGVKHYVQAKPANYNPRFAILLDMVGDKKAMFMPEFNSAQAAPNFVREIWETAAKLGLTHFKSAPGQDIADDHLPLIQAGIPTVDLIDGELVGYKGPDPDRKYWHTTDDLPKHLSAETLGEVGKLLLTLIYNRIPQDIPKL
jgi:glutaminyl-peptide cyclotransferase